MTNEKGHIRRDLENIKPGGVMVVGIIIMAVIAVVIAVVLEQDDTKIDSQKDVYLFLQKMLEAWEIILQCSGGRQDRIT
jgi:hypothetical protein